jgi:hypothetical protein
MSARMGRCSAARGSMRICVLAYSVIVRIRSGIEERDGKTRREVGIVLEARLTRADKARQARGSGDRVRVRAVTGLFLLWHFLARDYLDLDVGLVATVSPRYSSPTAGARAASISDDERAADAAGPSSAATMDTRKAKLEALRARPTQRTSARANRANYASLVADAFAIKRSACIYQHHE